MKEEIMEWKVKELEEEDELEDVYIYRGTCA